MQHCSHCGHEKNPHTPFCHGYSHGGYHSCPPSFRPSTDDDVPPAFEEVLPPPPPPPPPTPSEQPPVIIREEGLAAKVDKLTQLVGKLASKVEDMEKKMSAK
jgi:hypothetical protein